MQHDLQNRGPFAAVTDPAPAPQKLTNRGAEPIICRRLFRDFVHLGQGDALVVDCIDQLVSGLGQGSYTVEAASAEDVAAAGESGVIRAKGR